MENTDKTVMAETEKVFDDFPELKKYSGRYKAIQSFIDDGAAETDLTLVRDDYKTALKLQDSLFVELLMYYVKKYSEISEEAMKQTDTTNKLNQELVETINKDRAANKEVFESICLTLLVSPIDGFQVLLDYIEREQKKDDLTGKGWLWSLKFSFPARLHCREAK